MICCLVADPPRAALEPGLEAVARACSPRIAVSGSAVVFDASGLSGMFGSAGDIGEAVVRLAAERGLTVRVALASTATAAWLLAHARTGVTVAPAGRDAACLAPVPLAVLADLPDLAFAPEAAARRRARPRNFRAAPPPNARPASSGIQGRAADAVTSKAAVSTLSRWGLRTLGDVARLARADVHTRLGPIGVRLHQAACGEDARPFVPMADAVRWIERLECDWPIDGLEPLSFVLSRLCDAFSGRLERADRGAVEVTTRLQLVTREVHTRTLHLPAPMRDARGLRTLVLLDLESHPAPAGIDAVEIELDVAPGSIVRGSLLAPAVPAPEDLATLTARLGALMGESRIGAPVLVDSHDARAIAMTKFSPPSPSATCGGRACPAPAALRRFRLPIAARVVEDHHTPVRVWPAVRGLAGGDVKACAGPWRTSSGWWTHDDSMWDRDEWDVALADGGIYRLARDRATGSWVIEGTVD